MLWLYALQHVLLHSKAWPACHLPGVQQSALHLHVFAEVCQVYLLQMYATEHCTKCRICRPT
jgi:hypothetical protein